MVKKMMNPIPVLKRWIWDLNAEKILLAASVLVFILTFLSQRGKMLKDTTLSKREKEKRDYIEKIKDHMGIPDEIQIPSQRIDDITLTDPQVIFARDRVSVENGTSSRNTNRNPFFPESSGKAASLMAGEKGETVLDKEEFLFVGIMCLDGGGTGLSVVLKGSRSGEYKTLFEGDELDGIKIISIDMNFARIMDRKGIIQNYTTAPNRAVIK